MEAPTAQELADHPVARETLGEAWKDSLADDPVLRHEEGGWIYMDPGGGQCTVRRATAGMQSAVDLSDPRVVSGSVVVGKFHTHPNPTAEGWKGGPSAADLLVAADHGVPALIYADDGIQFSGPERRWGVLVGNP